MTGTWVCRPGRTTVGAVYTVRRGTSSTSCPVTLFQTVVVYWSLRVQWTVVTDVVSEVILVTRSLLSQWAVVTGTPGEVTRSSRVSEGGTSVSDLLLHDNG